MASAFLRPWYSPVSKLECPQMFSKVSTQSGRGQRLEHCVGIPGSVLYAQLYLCVPFFSWGKSALIWLLLKIQSMPKAYTLISHLLKSALW